MAEMRNAYKIIIGRKRPPGRPRHKWEDIRMSLKDIGWTDSICSGQGPMMNPRKHCTQPSDFIKPERFLKGTS
jgi:hypothetical protein